MSRLLCWFSLLVDANEDPIDLDAGDDALPAEAALVLSGVLRDGPNSIAANPAVGVLPAPLGSESWIAVDGLLDANDSDTAHASHTLATTT